MTKFKSISSIVALAVTLITAIAVVVAWYTPADKVADMSFNILQIDSLVTLYEANDSNYNGVPNKQTNANVNKYYNPEAAAYVEYKNIYYNENYSFNYVDQKYALSQDSKANLLNDLKITDAVPSKVYSYKFEITNYVGKDNDLTFTFLEDSQIDKSILKDFEVRLGVINSNATVTYTEWTSFCTESSYSGISLNPLNSTMVLPSQTGSLSVGRLDLWLQIKIKDEAVNYPISEFVLPLYRIELSCEIPD